MAEEASETWWTNVLAGTGGDLHANEGEDYVVLPKPTTPRVVVDRSEEQAVRDALSRMAASRTSFGPAQTLIGSASTLVTKRKPAWTVSPGRSGSTLRAHLAEVLDTDLRISVSVGPPRPNRKPVIRCYRDDGIFAVAKLGPEAPTAEMVRNEARWLDVMAAQPLDGIQTPPLLHSGEFGNGALLVMGALDLTSDLGVEFDEVPVQTAIAFASRYAENERVTDSDWWHRLPVRMNDAALDSVQAQLAQMAKHEHFAAVETSAWHGDWSPWNMGWSTAGKLCIWDWERAAVGVPTGFDLLHLHYQYGDGINAAAADLELMGVPREQHVLVKRMYLFELCARHCEAGVLQGERHAQVISTLESLR